MIERQMSYNLPFDQYRSVTAINASSIAAGRKSMRHMHDATTSSKPATTAMMLGTQAHYIVLEGGKGVAQCDARRGSTEWKDAVKLAGSESLVMKSADYERIMRMRERVEQSADAMWLLDKSAKEVSGFWSGDYGDGKIRLDMLGDSFIADYKTTSDATPSAFFSTAERLGYHAKMGWYRHGIKSIRNDDLEVYLLVQETSSPYDCWVCHMPRQIVEQGEEEAIRIAKQYHVSQICGSFEGLADGIIEYQRPAWATGKDDGEVDISNGEMEASEL